MLIKDASNNEFTLEAIEDPVGCRQIVFPVEVSWQWVTPDELPKAGWKDKIWWKTMGFFANHELRGYSMRFHARLQLLVRKVTRLTDGFIRDHDTALMRGSSLVQETNDQAIDMAIEVLTEVDDLLLLGFRCRSGNLSIGEVADAAGCSWSIFLEAYMTNRNNALQGTDDLHERRDMIGAAIKGVDGLELLFQQLVHQIDNNDLMAFKLWILFVNAITCLAGFFWSDYIVPEINPPKPTPMPTWQGQIAHMFNITRGV